MVGLTSGLRTEHDDCYKCARARIQSSAVALAYRGSAALALEFAHKADERFDRRRLDGVIEGNPHSADRAMARCAHKSRCRSLFAEFFFGGFVRMRGCALPVLTC